MAVGMCPAFVGEMIFELQSLLPTVFAFAAHDQDFLFNSLQRFYLFLELKAFYYNMKCETVMELIAGGREPKYEKKRVLI